MRAFAQTRPWCACPRVLRAHVSVVMIHARQPCFPKLLWFILYLLDGYWSVDLFHASNARLIDFRKIYLRHFGLTHADNRTTLTLCKHSSRGWLCFIYLFILSKESTHVETSVCELHIKPQANQGSHPREIPQCWYCKGHRCLISATGSSSQPAIDHSVVFYSNRKKVINIKWVTDSCTCLKDAL